MMKLMGMRTLKRPDWAMVQRCLVGDVGDVAEVNKDVVLRRSGWDEDEVPRLSRVDAADVEGQLVCCVDAVADADDVGVHHTGDDA